MEAQASIKASKKWVALVAVLAIALTISLVVNVVDLREIQGLRRSLNELNQTYVGLCQRYDELNKTYFSLQLPAVTGIVDLKSEGQVLDRNSNYHRPLASLYVCATYREYDQVNEQS